MAQGGQQHVALRALATVVYALWVYHTVSKAKREPPAPLVPPKQPATKTDQTEKRGAHDVTKPDPVTPIVAFVQALFIAFNGSPCEPWYTPAPTRTSAPAARHAAGSPDRQPTTHPGADSPGAAHLQGPTLLKLHNTNALEYASAIRNIQQQRIRAAGPDKPLPEVRCHTHPPHPRKAKALPALAAITLLRPCTHSQPPAVREPASTAPAAALVAAPEEVDWRHKLDLPFPWPPPGAGSDSAAHPPPRRCGPAFAPLAPRGEEHGDPVYELRKECLRAANVAAGGANGAHARRGRSGSRANGVQQAAGESGRERRARLRKAGMPKMPKWARFRDVKQVMAAEVPEPLWQPAGAHDALPEGEDDVSVRPARWVQAAFAARPYGTPADGP